MRVTYLFVNTNVLFAYYADFKCIECVDIGNIFPISSKKYSNMQSTKKATIIRFAHPLVKLKITSNVKLCYGIVG